MRSRPAHPIQDDLNSNDGLPGQPSPLVAAPPAMTNAAANSHGDVSDSLPGEMLLHLHDRLDGVARFLLAVFFVEIQVERAIADIARIRRVEVVRKVRTNIGPVENEVLVVRIEIDSFGAHRLGKLDLAASDAIALDHDRIEERRVGGRKSIWTANLGR